MTSPKVEWPLFAFYRRRAVNLVLMEYIGCFEATLAFSQPSTV